MQTTNLDEQHPTTPYLNLGLLIPTCFLYKRHPHSSESLCQRLRLDTSWGAGRTGTKQRIIEKKRNAHKRHCASLIFGRRITRRQSPGGLATQIMGRNLTLECDLVSLGRIELTALERMGDGTCYHLTTPARWPQNHTMCTRRILVSSSEQKINCIINPCREGMGNHCKRKHA